MPSHTAALDCRAYLALSTERRRAPLMGQDNTSKVGNEEESQDIS